MVTHLHKCTHTVNAHTLTQKHKKTLMRDSYCAPLTILCLGKKNINLSSLKGSALLSHLRPTWARIWVESTPPLNSSHHHPPHSLSLLPSQMRASKAPCTLIGGALMLYASSQDGKWVIELQLSHILLSTVLTVTDGKFYLFKYYVIVNTEAQTVKRTWRGGNFVTGAEYSNYPSVHISMHNPAELKLWDALQKK